MAGQVRAVKGTRVLLPPDSAVWAEVEMTARRVFGSYGFGEIRTPIIEHTELFVRGVGETSDIVGKEMYSFQDRKGRELSLRPEGTAPVVRSFVGDGLSSGPMPQRLYYIGPYFRYERPQKGRYRQFHQIGAEILGDAGPLSDAELIAMLMQFLRALGHNELEVLINTVGDTESRQRYREALAENLGARRSELTADSQRRLETNPLRILDSKAAQDQEVLADAPALDDFLSDASRAHFDAVLNALDHRGIPTTRSPRLVRGLDYYTRTVFEIVSSDLGAQDAIVGGGRYDGLIAELGGPQLQAIGFAIGEDRLIDTLPAEFVDSAMPEAPVMVVPIGEDSTLEAFDLAEELRGAGLAVVLEDAGRGLGKSLRYADRIGSRRVVLLGEDEIDKGVVTVRDLARGSQQEVGRGSLAVTLGELE